MMANDVQRQHDLTKALETATRFRKGADTRWRSAIAEALAAGVPRDVILKVAGGWDVIEVQDILRDIEQHRLGAIRSGNQTHMSEAQTPEEEIIETDMAEIPAEVVPVDDEYVGPDPENDPKGDGSDEDQGT